ncbi:hypothetical protein ACET3Z_016494 [Daucus carota]
MVLIEKKLLPLQSGVAKLIDQAFAKGVKVAICSTSNEKAVCFIRISFVYMFDKRSERESTHFWNVQCHLAHAALHQYGSNNPLGF